MNSLLNENEVIEAVEQAFAARGFRTAGKCSTAQCGVDLHMSSPTGRKWLIEAKGATSASTSSKRFGRHFTASQVGVHVAKAIHQALSLRAKHNKCAVAVALPDDKFHRKEIAAVGDALEVLGIPVIWVSSARVVQLPTEL